MLPFQTGKSNTSLKTENTFNISFFRILLGNAIALRYDTAKCRVVLVCYSANFYGWPASLFRSVLTKYHKSHTPKDICI